MVPARRATSSPLSGRPYRSATSASRRAMSSRPAPVRTSTRICGWRSCTDRSAGRTASSPSISVVATRTRPESLRSDPNTRCSPRRTACSISSPPVRMASPAAVSTSPSGVRENSFEPRSRSSADKRLPTVVLSTPSLRPAAASVPVRANSRKKRRSLQFVIPAASSHGSLAEIHGNILGGLCINADAMKGILYRALMSLFVPAGTAALAQTSALSVEEARTIVAPLYEALNEPAKKDVAKLLAKATSPEWLSCSGNDACVSREKVVARFQGSGDAVPDLKWEILELLVSGDRVIVRGEASGGPIRPFLGVDPNGRRFKIMSIDVHTIEKGKIARSYHVEDWAAAIRQLRGS